MRSPNISLNIVVAGEKNTSEKIFSYKFLFRETYKNKGGFSMYKGSYFWSGILSGGISQIEDMRLYMKGDLTAKDLGVNTTRNVTGTVGIIAGMEYGAVIGSAVLPGVGTILGSIVGFMVGNRAGSYAGYQVGNMVFKQTQPVITGNTETRLKIEQKN
ncbi:hypothetical protein [Priestia megaterium]|uniref:hypothetical protein n=1 Tax=Priestia megaterium TaxID=1404 RepID=UPI00159C30C2|nr:hypothetical protein [Priestia megaterium]